MPVGYAFLAALIFGGGSALLSLARSKYKNAALVALGNLVITGVITFVITLIAFWRDRPMTTFVGLFTLLFVNVCVAAVVAIIVDICDRGIGGATVVGVIAGIVLLSVGVSEYNSGHGATVTCPTPSTGLAGATKSAPHICSKAAYGLVNVTEESNDQLPASATSNMVVVSEDVAAQRASQAMSSGIASTRNFSSYLNLGDGFLQMVDNHMWYVFPLEFQGAINKHRLNNDEPGYIMISAEDPNAEPVERYDANYSMIVSEAGGQGSEPQRWAYDHGYSKYVLDDPTLEIQDGTGDPYYTVTLLRPQIGWTFAAPVGVLLINAHTGQITRYDLPGRGAKNPVPSWVDRVYSAKLAGQIANWYGHYAHAPFGGRGNTNRYQVSGDPVLVYTGDGNPSWRMLLTSYGSTSVYRIVEMDAATGAMQIYQPANPMGVESAVYSAFCNGGGVGASLIKANHLLPEDLTLHIIYGHLVWLVSYETSATTDTSGGVCESDYAPSAHPTFSGIGLVDAYNASANNVAFGSNKAEALQNLLTQLASQGGANGNAPGAGGQYVTVTGTVANIAWDIQGGTKYYYFTLNGAKGKPDNMHVYEGDSSLGPAIVVAQPGDHVTMTVLKVTQSDSQETMQSFSDSEHPVSQQGSTPNTTPTPSASQSATQSALLTPALAKRYTLAA